MSLLLLLQHSIDEMTIICPIHVDFLTLLDGFGTEHLPSPLLAIAIDTAVQV